jgi:hypothetical protein
MTNVLSEKDLKKVADSNLVINWVTSSPSTVAYFKRIGLMGSVYQDASIEMPDGSEVWYAKVDGVRYRILEDEDRFQRE